MREPRTKPARATRKIERRTVRPARFADPFEQRVAEQKVIKRRGAQSK
jgi:hypothetical protein